MCFTLLCTTIFTIEELKDWRDGIGYAVISQLSGIKACGTFIKPATISIKIYFLLFYLQLFQKQNWSNPPMLNFHPVLPPAASRIAACAGAITVVVICDYSRGYLDIWSLFRFPKSFTYHTALSYNKKGENSVKFVFLYIVSCNWEIQVTGTSHSHIRRITWSLLNITENR
jgi:hypothetical protein